MAGVTIAMAATAQEITFANTDHDFGVVPKGSAPAVHVFNFTNTGNVPLILTGHTTSCGCTVPDYPKDKPIMPGESGAIKVQYNNTGANQNTHSFDRTVTIKSNAANNPDARLRIRGSVK